MDHDDSDTELEVTVKFAVPVPPGPDLDPHEIATRIRERWIEEPLQLAQIIFDALTDDFDLQVRPVAVS